MDNDNIQAAYDATNHLISLGHQRIGFVSGPPNLSVSQDRLGGYHKALRKANLPDRPTALVCMDDIVTYGVLRGLNELGYCVPQDVGLISFNNLELY